MPQSPFLRRIDRSPLPAVGVVLLLSLAATGFASWLMQRRVQNDLAARCRSAWPAAESAFRRQLIRHWEGLLRLEQQPGRLATGDPERLSEALQDSLWFDSEVAFLDVGVAVSEDGPDRALRVKAVRQRDGFGFNGEGRDLRANLLVAPLLDPALDRGVAGVSKPFRVGKPGKPSDAHPLRTQILPLRAERGENPSPRGDAVLFATFDQTRLGEMVARDLAALAVSFEVLEDGEDFAPVKVPCHDIEPTVLGVIWHVRIAAKPELMAAGDGRLNLPLLGFGCLASLAMSGVTWRQVGRRMQAEAEREELQHRTAAAEKRRLDLALHRRGALLQLAGLHTLPFAEQLPRVLAETSALLGGAGTSFWRFSADGSTLSMVAGHPAPDGETALANPTAEAPPEFFQTPGPEPDTRAEETGLSAPVIIDGRRAGLLRVASPGPGKAWSGEETEIVKTIAQHLALALATEISRAANEELVRALARAEELNQLKSRVVNFVSHELRTPLAIIQSSADMLTGYQDQLSAGRRDRHLANIGDAVQRMNGLVAQVLSLQNATGRDARFTPDAIDLAALCIRIKTEAELAGRGRCTVTLATQGGLASARGDEKLLRPLLANLVSNAIKYSPPGSVVELNLRRLGDDAIFDVADRGIGIPPEDRAGLFEDFHRARNIGSVPGFGLGLAIVKRCVEDHGGEIRIEPRPGGGTLATVTLPMFAPPSTPPVPA